MVVAEDSSLELVPHGGLTRFLQLLKEMDEEGASEAGLSGVVEGPLFSRASYGCRVRIGLEKARRRGKHG